MSTDKKVTKDLIETLKDGAEGYTQAAEQVSDSDRPDLVTALRGYASQREGFASELETMAAQYGDDIDESGSAAAGVHRAWMSLKDAISGSSPKGVLDAAEQGEDHAVSEFKDALDKDISADLRTTVQRQFADVQKAHGHIKQLRDSLS